MSLDAQLRQSSLDDLSEIVGWPALTYQDRPSRFVVEPNGKGLGIGFSTHPKIRKNCFISGVSSLSGLNYRFKTSFAIKKFALDAI